MSSIESMLDMRQIEEQYRLKNAQLYKELLALFNLLIKLEIVEEVGSAAFDHMLSAQFNRLMFTRILVDRYYRSPSHSGRC